MPISPEEVQRLAELAGLPLDSREARRTAEQLSGIVDRIAVLRDVPLPPGGAAEGAAERDTPLRQDVEAFDPLILPPESLAPAWQDSFFLVPRLAALGSETPGGTGG